jgi:hypothetical protein
MSLAIGLACALLGAPASAAAAEQSSETDVNANSERPRIVLVVGPDLEGLTTRFMAELASMHFDVTHVEVSSAPRLDELDQLARRQAAQVAVLVSRAGSAVDLWVVNPKNGELHYRRVVADGDPAVVALRALEILRGALVELQALPAKRGAAPATVERSESSPADEARQPSAQRVAPTLWLGGSAALFATRVARDLSGGTMLGLYSSLGSRFALRADLLLALSDWRVEGEGGEARIQVGAATVGALVVPWGEGIVTPGLGLGIGALALYTLGEARAGYRATTELNVVAFPHGRLELGLSLSDSIRLRATFVAGFATPRPVLLFADEKAKAWLNPLWVSTLGVEVALH